MSSISYSTLWSDIKSSMLLELYTTQIKFWNIQLAKLIQQNGHSHGVVISEAQASRSAIQHNNRSWTCLPIYWYEAPQNPEYHFPLTEGNPQMEKELVKITEELTTLKQERYETDRFMSAFSMYAPTQDQMKQVFGENLFGAIKNIVGGENTERDDILQLCTLEEFIKLNAPIINHMQERILVNLLMTDILTD